MNYNSEYDGMGGALVMCVLIIAGVIFALKHSERKSKTNTMTAQQMQSEQMQAQQRAIAAKFQNQHGSGPFDHADFGLAKQVVDFARSNPDDMQAVTGVAGIFGNLRKNTAEETAKRTAQEMMNRFKSQTETQPAAPQQHTVQPEIRYIEKPVYIDHTGREIPASGQYRQPEPDNGNGRFSRVNGFDHYRR